jgi:hypothetical protein
LVEVSDAAHEPEATQIDLAGYRSCRNEHCGALVLLEVTYRTGGLCVECFRGDLGRNLAEIEVRNQGRDLTMRMPAGKRAEEKGNRWTHMAATKARSRADKRLRSLFRDLHDVLLAEERARLGLDPFPLETIVHEPPDGDPSESIAFARVYAALDQHGVDVDGLEVPPTS